MITLEQIRDLKKRAGNSGAMGTWALATIAIEVPDDETLGTGGAEERFGDSSLSTTFIHQLGGYTGALAKAACELIYQAEQGAA